MARLTATRPANVQRRLGCKNGCVPLVSEADMAAALASLPGWNRENDEIVKVYELETFLAVVAFVGVIAELAEAADHHPDLDIRYRRLRVSLTSHDMGGL